MWCPAVKDNVVFTNSAGIISDLMGTGKRELPPI